MSDEWLNTEETAEILGRSVQTIRAMLRDGRLSGEKLKNRWRIKKSEVEQVLSTTPSAPPKVDAGMVEVSMALAGIAAALAALLPGLTGTAENIRLLLAFLAGVLAVFSAYSALWLLARYCLEGNSFLGFREIWALLTSPARVGPYWFLALGLLVWLVLSALIGALAVLG